MRWIYPPSFLFKNTRPSVLGRLFPTLPARSAHTSLPSPQKEHIVLSCIYTAGTGRCGGRAGACGPRNRTPFPALKPRLSPFCSWSHDLPPNYPTSRYLSVVERRVLIARCLHEQLRKLTSPAPALAGLCRPISLMRAMAASCCAPFHPFSTSSHFKIHFEGNVEDSCAIEASIFRHTLNESGASPSELICNRRRPSSLYKYKVPLVVSLPLYTIAVSFIEKNRNHGCGGPHHHVCARTAMLIPLRSFLSRICGSPVRVGK